MRNSTKIFRLMNHDSSHRKPEFNSYTLEDLNSEFDKNYSSIEEAIDDDPEYLFDEEQMNEYLSNAE